MPTFTTIALDNFLQRDSSYSNDSQSADNSRKPLTLSLHDYEKQTEEDRAPSNHLYLEPGLYTTPEQAPLPEVSPEYPSSPSPYVVNHKRRGAVNEGRKIGEFEIPPVPQPAVEDVNVLELSKENEVVEDNFLGAEAENDGFWGKENEDFEFLDPVSSSRFETESVGSEIEEGSVIKGLESQSFVSGQGEFFDADEEFSSDGSTPSARSHGCNMESERQAVRLSLLAEIDRRKTAEDTLMVMRSQWQRISNLLAQAGLTLPALDDTDDASLENLFQEITVARFVAEAMGKGEARAEADLAAQAIIESKEQEISRLRDRLQYYEAVNLEMSQRNQEIVDLTRRRRQRKMRQRKWLWSCIGLSVAIGASIVAYSYLPLTSKEQPLPRSDDSVDGSFISSETQ